MLREKVLVRTATGSREGELFVGVDGLPKLDVFEPPDALLGHEYFTPSSLPKSWYISSTKCGVLYTAWEEISQLLNEIKEAEREVEVEESHVPNPSDLTKADMEVKDEQREY